MHCFQNILMIAPQAERADRALEHPVAVAQACGATMTVVAVLDGATAPRTTSPRTSSLRVETALENMPEPRATQAKQLAALVEPFERRGVNISGRVLAGEPVPEIIRQVERKGHDLVVVPVAAQKPVSGRLLGIPIVPLMRGCPCPVWVLKPTPALDGGILVAVNPGSPEDQDGALSHSLIQLAARFARAVGGPLSILHVWHLTGESQIRRPLVGAKSEQIAALRDEAFKRAAIKMQQLLEEMDLGESTYEIYLEEGHQPAKVIAEFAVRRKIETVVMGMTGRSGIPGLLVGNSAEEVLRGVPCSVVTLGPDCAFPPIGPDEDLLADAGSRTHWTTESTVG